MHLHGGADALRLRWRVLADRPPVGLDRLLCGCGERLEVGHGDPQPRHAAQSFHSHVRVAFALGIVALLLLPTYVAMARFLYTLRKSMRMSRPKANALKSPLFKVKTPIRGG
mmetsp:Transcript_93572/g.217531  ORF Transcript_93572/g.217531 Transcript_93572/m.217531 type:complete len:112 (-) Transcript_93572:76-411(-)